METRRDLDPDAAEDTADTRQEAPAMARITRFDHIGITVADLDRVASFLVSLGLEVDGRTDVEGEFIDTVTGIPGSRSEILMLRVPGGGTAVELSRFASPQALPGDPTAMANVLGMRSIAFEVDDLQEIVARVTAEGFTLDGGIGRYEDRWLMAYVRGPEGLIVALAERLA
ncbi:VOC family protein [Demequina capsici]|uniref:VOC family protein n=1 Tax=Demequina capsici TaxID=3075620 RepID=A0AA96FBW2_9MICO|nr:VOC family protein [Demequina sp. PMTSA13]WNM26515.1 VOC family protein [Demequina sp. PMTSA13]